MEVNKDQPWSCILPAYSPAVDTPRYTPEPRPDEERVQINRRLIREESGVYVVKNKHVTIALTNQIPNCKEPTYGKAANVQGALSLSKPEGVLSVEVKLEGLMELMMTSVVIAGNTEVPLFTDQEVLFRRSEPSSVTEPKRSSFSFSRTTSTSSTTAGRPQICTDHCPSTLTFSLRIPTTYSHNGISRPLPPSYTARFGSIPGITLDARYNLRVTIHRKGSLVDKKVVVTTPIVFIPRSRPSQPALPPSMTFLSTLKSSPEEWKLFESTTGVRDGHGGSPVIHSALLLPRSQVFPLSQPIPFHLQLSCSSLNVLSPFSYVVAQSPDPRLKPLAMVEKPPYTMRHGPPSIQNSSGGPSRHKDTSRHQAPVGVASSNSTRSNNKQSPLSGIESPNSSEAPGRGLTSARIHISVQRHVAIEVLGQWIQLKKTLSKNSLKRCPINDALPNEAVMSTLAWEGQIEVLDEHRCGGFGGPGVRVKDFILLSIIPPDSEHSPLQEIHHLVPIRLTTDPYNEELIRDMELARQPGST